MIPLRATKQYYSNSYNSFLTSMNLHLTLSVKAQLQLFTMVTKISVLEKRQDLFSACNNSNACTGVQTDIVLWLLLQMPEARTIFLTWITWGKV